MSAGGLNSAKRALEAHWNSLGVVAITRDIVRSAGSLAERHGLRGYEVVQLACYVHLRRFAGGTARFLSFDARLQQAADAFRA